MLIVGIAMFNRYYQRELQNLRELAADFSRMHPAAAPLLSGQSSDPDVERLLEGVAFLTGLLRNKLDDNLPEIIHGLTDSILPHYLRPIPSTSIVVFAPKPSLQETMRVPAGTTLAANAVEGAVCRFQTCFDLEVHPLKLAAAETLRRAAEPECLRLQFQSTGPDLANLKIERLCFYLGGSYVQATDLHWLLVRHVRRITVRSLIGGQPRHFSPAMLKPIGFLRQNALFPFPTQAFSGYRMLQEYFVLPQKYMIFELEGWHEWQQRGTGTGFEVILEMAPTPIPLPDLTADQIFLYATPVVNLFAHEADPIQLDHRQEKVHVKASLHHAETLQVYGVERVTGIRQGTVEKTTYAPLNLFTPGRPETTVYQVVREVSPVSSTVETHLLLTYPADSTDPTREVLTIGLTCTNGTLPEKLRLGDICQPTSDSPELLTFQNILPATAPIDPILAGKGIWKLLSHLSLNLLPLLNCEGLKEVLRLYLYPEGRDRVKTAANLKRVEGIAEVHTQPLDRLVKGHLMRGRQITLAVSQDHFAGMGDLFVFGSVLDEFFSQYSNMNSFTRLTINDLISGETLAWPERIGDRPLI